MRFGLIILALLSGPVFGDQCLEARKAVLKLYVSQEPDLGLEETKAFKANPKDWTDVMCGDVYGEGDDDTVGYKLCKREARVCQK